MKIRPASAHSFAEAMELAVKVHTVEELMDHLRRNYGFWNPTPENVTFKEYGGIDNRCGWNTYLVCVDGNAALFADGDPLRMATMFMQAREDLGVKEKRIVDCEHHGLHAADKLGRCNYCYPEQRVDLGPDYDASVKERRNT